MEHSSSALAMRAFGVGALTDAEALHLFELLGKVRADHGDLVDVPRRPRRRPPATR